MSEHHYDLETAEINEVITTLEKKYEIEVKEYQGDTIRIISSLGTNIYEMDKHIFFNTVISDYKKEFLPLVELFKYLVEEMSVIIYGDEEYGYETYADLVLAKKIPEKGKSILFGTVTTLSKEDASKINNWEDCPIKNKVVLKNGYVVLWIDENQMDYAVAMYNFLEKNGIKAVRNNE